MVIKMGIYDPSEVELEMLSNYLLEAANHFGTRVNIEFVSSTSLDNQHDPSYTYLPPMELDIILDERPNIEVLRSLNWYSEDEDQLPFLAYISKADINGLPINTIKGTRISIPYTINDSSGIRKFTVSEAKAAPPNSVYWVCKLVPEREVFTSSAESNPKQDPNFTYLRINKE